MTGALLTEDLVLMGLQEASWSPGGVVERLATAPLAQGAAPLGERAAAALRASGQGAEAVARAAEDAARRALGSGADVAETFVDSCKRLYAGFDLGGLSGALGTLGSVAFATRFCEQVLFALMPGTPYLNRLVMMAVVEPLIEESARRWVLQRHGTEAMGAFTLALNAQGTMSGIARLAQTGGSRKLLVSTRALSWAIGHLAASAQRNAAANATERSDPRAGLKAATALHAAWGALNFFLENGMPKK